MPQPLDREQLNEIADEMEDVQSDLLDVIDHLRQISRRLKDQHAEAYLIDPLEIIASDAHDFVSRDYNLTDWINEVRNSTVDAD